MKQYEAEVNAGGGVFFDVRRDDVYFTDPVTGSTLMIKAIDCTPSAVNAKIAASRKKYEEGKTKLQNRIAESLNYALYPRHFPHEIISDCAAAVVARIEIFRETGK